MIRSNCINVVNKLLEWELITESHAKRILQRYDKLYGLKELNNEH